MINIPVSLGSLVGTAVVATLLLGTPAYAQAKASDEKTREIDKIFEWATAATPGGVVAVSRNGKLIVNRAYGLADLERNVPISPDTVFDIGSLRKQFIAAAVFLLVEEKRLSLSDDVHKHFPELPDYGHKITLDHLLTHTSGLRDWTGLLPLTGGNADVMALILRQRGLNFAPGEEWSYSNTGYVLLKQIVARASGMSFADFTKKRLFEPLGMKSTTYREDLRDIVRNRALAYEKEGDSWQMAMLIGNDRGGGGALLSTASDLILWNEGLMSGRLGAFITDKIQEPAKLNNGRKLTYARGLFVDTSPNGGRVVSHSGGAAGYSAWLGRLPEHGLSIAVLTNREPMSATALARSVGNRFLPATDSKSADAKTAGAVADGTSVSVPDLDRRAGLFLSERGGEPLRLVASGGSLQAVGGGPLTAVTKDHFRNTRRDLFFLSQDEFELRFLSDDEIEMKSMEGKTTRFRRAAIYSPAAADLKAFAGRYSSDEIGSTFRVVPGKDGLVVHLEGSSGKGSEIRPSYSDTFQISRVSMRFLRDGTGKVVAFDYSSPVARGIRFMRLKD